MLSSLDLKSSTFPDLINKVMKSEQINTPTGNIDVLTYALLIRFPDQLLVK